MYLKDAKTIKSCPKHVNIRVLMNFMLYDDFLLCFDVGKNSRIVNNMLISPDESCLAVL